MWWTSGSAVPPLVTTSAANSSRAQAGVLSNPTTSVLFGQDPLDDGNRSGGRFFASREFSEIDAAVYVSGLYLANDYQSGDFVAISAGLPILARPFRDAQTQLENSELVAFPSVLTGTVAIDSYSELYGAQTGFANTLMRGTLGKLFLSTGYRFLSYRDQLAIREDLRSIDLGGAIPLNTEFVVRDSFEASNSFHGGSLGVGIQAEHQQWDYALGASVALGGLMRRLAIAGDTDVSVPSVPTATTAGGLLAQPTNIGSYSSTSQPL